MNILDKLKNMTVKIKDVPSPIPLPVLLHAVLVAFLVLAPTILLDLQLKKQVDDIDLAVSNLEQFKKIEDMQEATVSATPDPSLSPSPSVKPTPARKAVSTESAEEK
jgi:hypothetical protein